MGFKIVVSVGTAQMLRRNGIDCEVALKASEVRDGAESASILMTNVQGIEALRANETTVSSIQEIQHVPAR